MRDKKLRVLLVEGDLDRAQMAHRSVEADSDGFEIDVATTLAEARRSILQTAPQLVITDLVLPDGRGTELVAAADGTPVVVLARRNDATVVLQAAQRGALDEVVQTEGAEQKRADQEPRQPENPSSGATQSSMVSDLLTGVAHEVNQPLYAITNYAWACCQSLAASDRPVPVDKLKQWCESIQSAAQRASEIISRLRDFTQDVDSQREAVDLNEVIEHSFERMSHEAAWRQVTLQRAMSSIPPVVLAAPAQIQQVMVNLMRNACESTLKSNGQPSSQVVRVSTRVVGQYAEVLVTDHGIGIPEAPEILFGEFVTTKPTSMGMGLAVSRSIIQAHGGTIEARNNSGEGATFAFKLPLVREDRPDGP